MRRSTEPQIAAFQNVSTKFFIGALLGVGAVASVIQPIGGWRDLICIALGQTLTTGCAAFDVLATFAASS